MTTTHPPRLSFSCDAQPEALDFDAFLRQEPESVWWLSWAWEELTWESLKEKHVYRNGIGCI